MARDIQLAKRGTLYNADPTDLTLIWADGNDLRRGPRDLVLADWPNHEFVKRCYDATIAASTDNSHVCGMLTKLPKGGLMGILENVIVWIVPAPKDIAKSLGIDPGSDLLMVIDGRSRTKEAREANDRLRKAGETKLLLRVPFDTRQMDNTTAEFVKGAAQLHRKTMTPLQIAGYIQTATDAKMPREMILQEVKLEVWASAEQYLKLLKLDSGLQTLVDSGQMPLKAAIDIGKKHKAPEDQAQIAGQIAETVLQKKASGEKGKVKGNVAKSIADKATAPQTTADQPTAPPAQKPRMVSREVLEVVREGLKSTNPDHSAQLINVIGWILGGEVPDFIQPFIPADKKPGKPAVSTEAAQNAVAVRDALISSRYPVRFALMISERKYQAAGKTGPALYPDDACKAQPWYDRIHTGWLKAYDSACADSETPISRDKFFSKWMNKLEE